MSSPPLCTKSKSQLLPLRDEVPTYFVGGVEEEGKVKEGHFASLNEAVLFAEPYSRIEVFPGQYFENVVVTKPLEIVAAGSGNPQDDTAAAATPTEEKTVSEQSPRFSSENLEAEAFVFEVTREFTLEKNLVHFGNGVTLTHSCAANCRLAGDRVMCAGQPVPKDTLLTVNFNLFNYEIETPFKCECGAEDCVKQVTGFQGLEESMKEVMSPLVRTPSIFDMWVVAAKREEERAAAEAEKKDDPEEEDAAKLAPETNEADGNSGTPSKSPVPEPVTEEGNWESTEGEAADDAKATEEQKEDVAPEGAEEGKTEEEGKEEETAAPQEANTTTKSEDKEVSAAAAAKPTAETPRPPRPEFVSNGVTLSLSAEEALISGLSFTTRDSNSVAVIVEKGTPTIIDCQLSSMEVCGRDTKPRVESNIIRGGNLHGLNIREHAAGLYTKNEISFHEQFAVSCESDAGPQISHNTIHGGKQGQVLVRAGGAGTTAPVFCFNTISFNGERLEKSSGAPDTEQKTDFGKTSAAVDALFDEHGARELGGPNDFQAHTLSADSPLLQKAIDLMAAGEGGTSTTAPDPMLDWAYAPRDAEETAGNGKVFGPLGNDGDEKRKAWFKWVVTYTSLFATNRKGFYAITANIKGEAEADAKRVVVAAAMTAPPGTVPFSTDNGEMEAACGLAGFELAEEIMQGERIGALGEWQATTAASMSDKLGEKFLKVEVFATAPFWQGKGCGSALIKLLNEVADADGVPAYLETAGASNVGFYAKKGGFEEVARSPCADFTHEGGAVAMLRVGTMAQEEEPAAEAPPRIEAEAEAAPTAAALISVSGAGVAPVFHSNIIHSSPKNGVTLEKGAGGTWEKNKICACKGWGFLVEASEDGASGEAIRLTRNWIGDNAAGGLWIQGESTEGEAEDNDFIDNQGPQVEGVTTANSDVTPPEAKEQEGEEGEDAEKPAEEEQPAASSKKFVMSPTNRIQEPILQVVGDLEEARPDWHKKALAEKEAEAAKNSPEKETEQAANRKDDEPVNSAPVVVTEPLKLTLTPQRPSSGPGSGRSPPRSGPGGRLGARTLIDLNTGNPLRDPSGVPVKDRELRLLFATYDKDNSGTISKKEFLAEFRTFESFGLRMTDQQIDDLFAKFHQRSRGRPATGSPRRNQASKANNGGDAKEGEGAEEANGSGDAPEEEKKEEEDVRMTFDEFAMLMLHQSKM